MPFTDNQDRLSSSARQETCGLPSSSDYPSAGLPLVLHHLGSSLRHPPKISLNWCLTPLLRTCILAALLIYAASPPRSLRASSLHLYAILIPSCPIHPFFTRRPSILTRSLWRICPTKFSLSEPNAMETVRTDASLLSQHRGHSCRVGSEVKTHPPVVPSRPKRLSTTSRSSGLAL